MKKITLLFLLIVIFNISFAQDAVKDEIVRIEKERFAAMVNKNFDFLEKVLSNDLHYIHSDGSVDTKDSWLESIRSAKRSYDKIDLQESKVRIFNKTTAILNGICTYYYPNGGTLKLQYTNVYVKDKKEGWKMVSWQSFRY
jgi:hypothetical protein